PGLVQRARRAAGGGLLELRDARPVRNERRGGLVERQLSWHGSRLPSPPNLQRYDEPRGAVAEWLGRGLQSLAHQFDSGRRLSVSAQADQGRLAAPSHPPLTRALRRAPRLAGDEEGVSVAAAAGDSGHTRRSRAGPSAED